MPKAALRAVLSADPSAAYLRWLVATEPTKLRLPTPYADRVALGVPGNAPEAPPEPLRIVSIRACHGVATVSKAIPALPGTPPPLGPSGPRPRDTRAFKSLFFIVNTEFSSTYRLVAWPPGPLGKGAHPA